MTLMEESFISWEIFKPLDESVRALLSEISPEIGAMRFAKMHARHEQFISVYNALKETYLANPSKGLLMQIIVDLTVVTSRLTDPAWGLTKHNESLCKKIIKQVYDTHDMMKLIITQEITQ